MAQFVSLGDTTVEVHDDAAASVTPPQKKETSPWAMAIGTSIVGAVTVWTLERIVRAAKGKKR